MLAMFMKKCIASLNKYTNILLSRSVGGIRVSQYNGISVNDFHVLTEFIRNFYLEQKGVILAQD